MLASTITHLRAPNTVARLSSSSSSRCIVVLRSYATTTESEANAARHDLPPPTSPPSTSFAHTHSQSSPSTSSTISSSTAVPGPSSSKQARIRLYPRPRPAASHKHGPSAHPKLPPTFGQNQLLPVSNSTRALLESVVGQFDAPIRYAFAYGSGVFEQDGYQPVNNSSISGGQVLSPSQPQPEKPMLDFIFAVTHPAHFHSINMHQFPGHYPLHARMLGSSYVSKIQDVSPGIWFNAYVPMNGVTIKYGITTVDNLCSDLLNWRTLYLAGRMHKPLRIIKDDARVRLTQQVNLTSALRVALLCLPSTFTEQQLFEQIASLSYMGDPRMILPAENRGKVGNIVRNQGAQFRELYWKLGAGLPGLNWKWSGQPLHGSNAASAFAHHDAVAQAWDGSTVVKQDVSPRARAAHLRKLPAGLLQRVKENYARKWGVDVKELLAQDETAFWVKLAGDEGLEAVLREELVGIVRVPATVQSIKGLVTAGIGKSIRYSTAKIGKWWAGKGTSS
ncbi:Mmp37-domain-containing protein [Coprinopsis marcescibilis]|uniref:Phosphatidate cytidylyltransferase, mitochondrial n=1 Tax=Coprinopsis marcescibilis TaxID=230819 RepID=A0A5C3KBE2_COPMA|nr:Mmp37-domain-containing protein [Coprinopsis marcescibilis]